MTKLLGNVPSSVALVISLVMVSGLMAPATVAAKDDNARDRIRFYGWVESMPDGLHGIWIIGGQQVTTHPRIQFDQVDGPLQVGGCAKVEIRGGVVHEIDSEPAGDCR